MCESVVVIYKIQTLMQLMSICEILIGEAPTIITRVSATLLFITTSTLLISIIML